jgi:hypothetical protein
MYVISLQGDTKAYQGVFPLKRDNLCVAHAGHNLLSPTCELFNLKQPSNYFLGSSLLLVDLLKQIRVRDYTFCHHTYYSIFNHNSDMMYLFRYLQQQCITKLQSWPCWLSRQ